MTSPKRVPDSVAQAQAQTGDLKVPAMPNSLTGSLSGSSAGAMSSAKSSKASMGGLASIADLQSQAVQVPLPKPLGPRVLLVGTAQSTAQLAAGLALVQPKPEVVGCWLVGEQVEGRKQAGGDDGVSSGGGVSGGATKVDMVVLGSLIDLHEPEEVLVCLPQSLHGLLEQIGEHIQASGIKWQTLPTLGDQLAGRCGVVKAATIDTARLINRPKLSLDQQALSQTLTGKRVLITGSGGSIGSELARQVACFNPSELLLVERSENALFEIDRQIGHLFPELKRKAMLHDVTQQDATLELCLKHRPQVVFHAAAHKHVPMMEDHPAQAVENNFYGTRSMVDAATACGAERFVMISTDKAVNPSSVMGATKRLAELYVAHADQRSQTVCSMVRFGNVLGSACSVLPIWSKQLEHGGPITVTDERMTRYFMTIPEAASLVMQAGAYSQGGEVFLLDMGQPIRILDMARRFIESHGLVAGVDVKISITGARPGEKLFEELAYSGEDMLETPHPSVRIWQSASADHTRVTQLVQQFDHMRESMNPTRPWSGVSKEQVVHALRVAIPEMVQAIAS